MTYRNITPETDAHLYIPGTDYLKPTIDIIFKMLMAANPEARKSLLTAVLQPKSPIESTDILNPEITPRDLFGKVVRLDVRVKLSDGTLVDIEMQTTHDTNFARRALFYTAKLAADTLNKGEEYKELPNICGIFIFDKVQFPRFMEAHSSFELARHIPPDGELLEPGLLRLDFLELPKMNASMLHENALLWHWSQFLAPKSLETMEQAVKSVSALNSLEKDLRTMSSDLRTRQLAQEREADRRIDELAIAGTVAKARAEARVEGEARGDRNRLRQSALGMIEVGISRELVCKALKITESELAAILTETTPPSNS